MTHRHHHQDDSSTTASSDLFSPIALSFFQQPQRQNNNNRPSSLDRASSMTLLPPLHDSSWIGARLSPICSFDKEGASDEEDNNDNDDYEENERQRAIHDTLESAPFVDERSSLLQRNQMLSSDAASLAQNRSGNWDRRAFGSGAPSYPSNAAANHHPHNNNKFPNPSTEPAMERSKIHPLWKSPPPNTGSEGTTMRHGRFQQLWCYCLSSSSSSPYAGFGGMLLVISGIQLGGMAVYDAYVWLHCRYHFFNVYNTCMEEEDNTISSLHSWSLPWIIPPYDTLVTFGALSPNFIRSVEGGRVVNYTSFLSSLSVSTSVLEWLLVAVAWRILVLSSNQRRPKNGIRKDTDIWNNATSTTSTFKLTIVYVGSALTGQLWMFSYDTTELLAVGCLAWGTCGVLCAAGMAYPLHRFELFALATTLVLLSLFLRPYNSVFGCTGSAFLGWALGACGLVEQRNNTALDTVKYPGNVNDLKGVPAISFIGTGATVLIVSLPVLSMAFRRE